MDDQFEHEQSAPDRDSPESASQAPGSADPLIGAAGFDRVLRADRDVEFLLPVRIHVAEHHRERPVGVRQPAFIGRMHALTARVHETGLRATGGVARRHQRCDEERRSFHCCWPGARFVVGAVCCTGGAQHNGQPTS